MGNGADLKLDHIPFQNPAVQKSALKLILKSAKLSKLLCFSMRLLQIQSMPIPSLNVLPQNTLLKEKKFA